MESILGRYWLFATLCGGGALFILRLITRERVTLQGSLAYLTLLLGLAVAALFPELDAWVARAMGFSLVSNWFFAAALAGLSFLHLSALVQLSRVELRSIALTQQVGILQERLDRLDRSDRAHRSERIDPTDRTVREPLDSAALAPRQA